MGSLRSESLEITSSTGLHPRLSHRHRWSKPGNTPIVSGTVIGVDVEHLPRKTARAQKMLWLWWAGPAGTLPDLDICWRAYLHRFDRAQAPLRQDHARLSHPAGPHSRAGRSLDRPARRRLQPALTRAGVGRRPAIALGAAAQPRPTHPHPCAQGFLSTASGPGHPRQSAKTQQGRTPRAQGQSARPGPTIPGHQEGHLTPSQGLTRKLSEADRRRSTS